MRAGVAVAAVEEVVVVVEVVEEVVRVLEAEFDSMSS